MLSKCLSIQNVLRKCSKTREKRKFEERENLRREKEREGRRGKERERQKDIKTERKTLHVTIKLQNNTFFYIYLTFKASTDGM